MPERRSLLKRADVLTAIALVLLGLFMLWRGLAMDPVPPQTRPVAPPPVTEARAAPSPAPLQPDSTHHV